MMLLKHQARLFSPTHLLANRMQQLQGCSLHRLWHLQGCYGDRLWGKATKATARAHSLQERASTSNLMSPMEGIFNLADFLTKHHLSPNYKKVRPIYLHEGDWSLTDLQGCNEILQTTACPHVPAALTALRAYRCLLARAKHVVIT